MAKVNTIGRRKESVARIYMDEGEGNITINNRAVETYFPLVQHQYFIKKPLRLTENEGKYDIKVNLYGGGKTGQAEALCLAISRALTIINPEYRSILKEHGLLRRDSRKVERKKPGLPKARKKEQFSKR